MPGVERAKLEARTRDDAPPMNVWVYRSTSWKTKSLRACVLITSSGSTGITGGKLSEDDVAEHVPYVLEGCMVIAYDTDGAFGPDAPPDQYAKAMSLFMKADGGVENAKVALRAAAAFEERIDRRRVIAAGHGSAANVALLLAAREPSIRAVVAFAPISDVVTQVGDVMVDALDQMTPGFKKFITAAQPKAIAPQIKCPTMIFHATDDAMVPIEQTHDLVSAMTAAGNQPSLVEPKTGGHVRGMLDHGLTQAAAWVGELARRMPTLPTTHPSDGN